MVSQSPWEPHELNDIAEYLRELAALVEDTGLTPADVGGLLLDVFRRAPIEQPADVRRDVQEMSTSSIDAATFANGLRRQAELLEQMLLDGVNL